MNERPSRLSGNRRFSKSPRRVGEKALYPGGGGHSSGRGLQNFFEALQRGKLYIVGVFLLVFAAVVGYSYTIPVGYMAESLVTVNIAQGQGQANESVPTHGLIDAVGGRDVANQVTFLRESLFIAERAAARLREIRTIPQTGAPISVLGDSSNVYPVPVIARLVQGRMSIEPITDDYRRLTNTIRIRASGPDPYEAALIAELYAEEYVKYTRATSQERIIASRTFLEDQVARQHEELQAIEEDLKEFSSRERATSLDAEGQYMVTQSAQLRSALDEARIELSTRQASLRSTEQELENIHPRLAQSVASGRNREVEQIQAQIADLESVAEAFYLNDPSLRQNPEGNQELLRHLQRIDQLKERLLDISTQYVDEVLAVGGVNMSDPAGGLNYVAQLGRQVAEERVAISGIEARINALQGRLADYDQRLRAIPSQTIELAQMQRARESAEDVYRTLAQSLQEARLAEESEIGMAQVIRPAFIPAAPAGPNRVKYITLGAVLAWLTSIGVALLRHHFDRRIYTPDDLAERDIRMIDAIPDMQPLLRKEFNKKKTVVTANGSEISPILAPALLLPGSPPAEAYRNLYLNIQVSRPGTQIQTILVTSPEAGAGKSTTAANLAITLGQVKRRTLLVDADLRCPALHHYFGLAPRPSLRKLLTERDHGTEFEMSRFYSGIENVYTILVDEPVPNPGELLGSPDMRNLIQRFRQQFDVIVFDTPPVLAATDALLLSTQCDATVVVASAGQTKRDALEHTLNKLDSVGAHLVGTVLNRFDPSRAFGYKDTYGYQFGYYNHYHNQYQRYSRHRQKTVET